MLSDEEKISLNRMKLFARSSDLSVVTAKDMNIVVTLVEKQSKEIEELKNADLTTVYLNGFYDGEKKVKDKIKAKIEEYDDKEMTVNLVNRSAGKTFQQAVRNEVIKVLQSLL